MREAAPWAEAAGFRPYPGPASRSAPSIRPWRPRDFEGIFICSRHQGTSLINAPGRSLIDPTVGAVWQAPYELMPTAPPRPPRRFPMTLGARTPRYGDYRRISATQKRWSISFFLCSACVVARASSSTTSAHWRRRKACSAEGGLADAVILTGVYHTVCAILNAFRDTRAVIGRRMSFKSLICSTWFGVGSVVVSRRFPWVRRAGYEASEYGCRWACCGLLRETSRHREPLRTYVAGIPSNYDKSDTGHSHVSSLVAAVTATGKVRDAALANLSKLPADAVAAIEATLQATTGPVGTTSRLSGRCCTATWWR